MFAQINKTLNNYELKFSKAYEFAEFVLFSIVAFFVPFFLAHPQLLVGSVVNTMLFLAALNWRGYKILPLVFLPSFGVLAAGIIFGPFTIFLVYMMPFIWIGNFAIIYFFKMFKFEKKTNYAFASAVSILAKVAVIFLPAFLMVNAKILPPLFLTAMGILQLQTAIIGCIAAYGIYRVQKIVYA